MRYEEYGQDSLITVRLRRKTELFITGKISLKRHFYRGNFSIVLMSRIDPVINEPSETAIIYVRHLLATNEPMEVSRLFLKN